MDDSSKKVSIAVAVVIIIVVAAVVAFFVMNPANKSTGGNSQTTTSTTVDKTTSYAAADVAKHANENDCWTIISGNVYDITSYIPQHPNNDITMACGTDATTLFTERRTADRQVVGSGQGHDSGAAVQLAELQIGVLAK